MDLSIGTFSKNLAEALKAKNLTQSQLGRLLGTTQQTVSRWINGTNEPEINDLLRLCFFLDETPNDLLGYNDINKAAMPLYEDFYWKYADWNEATTQNEIDNCKKEAEKAYQLWKNKRGY